MYSMKKLMLLLSAGLLALPACTKKANEPAIKSNDKELTTINLHIEGEREDVSIVDEQGRALNLTADVNDQNQITKTTLKDGEVDGIIYVYKPGKLTNPEARNGIARKVTFKVQGKKITYDGPLANTRIQAGELPFLMMKIYIGGSIKDDNIEHQGGAISYSPVRKAIPTTNGMDLSVFNPVFYSDGHLVNRNRDSGADYVSTGHKFKLLGSFVSVKFRNSHLGGWSTKFNGLVVRGYAINGFYVEEPNVARNKGKHAPNFYPTVGSFGDELGDEAGIFIEFSDGKKYTIEGGTNAKPKNVETGREEDPAYTLYLLTEVEPRGGIRYGLNSVRTTPFPGHPRTYAKSNYWDHTTTKHGKFFNIILDVPKN